MQQCVQVSPNTGAACAGDQWQGCNDIEASSLGRLNFVPWVHVFVGSPVRNVPHIILPAPRILRWLTDFWKKSVNV